MKQWFLKKVIRRLLLKKLSNIEGGGHKLSREKVLSIAMAAVAALISIGYLKPEAQEQVAPLVDAVFRIGSLILGGIGAGFWLQRDRVEKDR